MFSLHGYGYICLIAFESVDVLINRIWETSSKFTTMVIIIANNTHVHINPVAELISSIEYSRLVHMHCINVRLTSSYRVNETIAYLCTLYSPNIVCAGYVMVQILLNVLISSSNYIVSQTEITDLRCRFLRRCVCVLLDRLKSMQTSNNIPFSWLSLS